MLDLKNLSSEINLKIQQVKDRETLDKLKKSGVDAFLIGESLVTSQNPSKNLRELVGNVK